MGVRVVSRRAITKDKFVPEGGQDLEFWEMSLNPEGLKFSWDGPPGDLPQGVKNATPSAAGETHPSSTLPQRGARDQVAWKWILMRFEKTVASFGCLV